MPQKPEPEYEVVEDRGWIPVRDGTNLAATYYRPKSRDRFPALVTYIPYRKDDITAPMDRKMYHYFAQRGYVGVRVDTRGTGSSEGVSENEFVMQEQLDGYDAVEWLAEQPWCTGKVGMQGISYGGYTPVLVAAHNPPHLTAISPWFFTDDGYTDGDHFEGGCMSVMGLGLYGLRMFTRNALPADPGYFKDTGGKWEKLWKKRLEQYTPWVLEWFDHQTNDEFWRMQSLRPDYDAIKCPVFMIGGWADHFRNAVLRMLEHLRVPKKALIGPWVHGLPDAAYPGPQIDYHRELIRWWDHWLKGVENGVMDEPTIAVYVQQNRESGLFTEQADGYWRYENEWPIKRGQDHFFYLHAKGALAKDPPTADTKTFEKYIYRPEVGLASNIWLGHGATLGREQNPDEAYSLKFTTDPLDEDSEILGFPRVQLYAASTAENTAFVVKLTEVNPAGESNLITYGVLNAAHRNSHTEPEVLEPGKVYQLDIEMSAVSWVFKRGHRIRLSVTSSHWPILWPLPEPAVNQVFFDASHPSKLILPVVPAPGIFQQPTFEPAVQVRPQDLKVKPGRAAQPRFTVTRDLFNHEVLVTNEMHREHTLLDRDLTFTYSGIVESRTSTDDPSISAVTADHFEQLQYANGMTVGSHGVGTISSNKRQFTLNLKLVVEVNGQPFFENRWLKSVSRRFI